MSHHANREFNHEVEKAVSPSAPELLSAVSYLKDHYVAAKELKDLKLQLSDRASTIAREGSWHGKKGVVVSRPGQIGFTTIPVDLRGTKFLDVGFAHRCEVAVRHYIADSVRTPQPTGIGLFIRERQLDDTMYHPDESGLRIATFDHGGNITVDWAENVSIDDIHQIGQILDYIEASPDK